MPLLKKARRAAHALAIATMLLPGLARAQNAVVSITSVTPPLRTGVTHRNTNSAPTSTLSLDVKNQRTDLPLREVDFTLPRNYGVSSVRVPAGWYVYSASNNTIQFRTTSCTGAGIAVNDTGNFLITVKPPAGAAASDVPETLTLKAGSCSRQYFWIFFRESWTSDWSTNSLPFVRRVLRLEPPSAMDTFTSSTVTWPVTNLSSASRTITLEPGAAPGLGAPSCPSVTLASGTSGAITCTYPPTSGSFSLAASARASASGTSTITALGSTGTVALGAVRVAWPSPVRAVTGRPASFTLTVTDDSPSLRLSKVEVLPPAGWTEVASSEGGGGLLPSKTGCVAGAACFLGPMTASQATLKFGARGGPAGDAAFTVRLTSAGGATMEYRQAVSVFAPPPDVSGFTVLSNADGQVLSWTNPEPHDGVVVFRSTPPDKPASPVDFVDYTAGGAFHADPPGSSRRDLTDRPGVFFYRVCNRDANRVYSDCKTGFWNGEGYADSVLAPTGWSVQLGSEAQFLPTALSGNRVAVFTHVPQQVTILDLPTGNRSFDPFPLPGLPSNRAVATRTSDGHSVLFVSDQSGSVRAIDLDTGALRWHIEKSESFVAGVAGIALSTAHPDFKASYAADVLLLGSATSNDVLAIDTRDGTELWRVDAGAPVNALITYFSATNRFYVPTDNGVAAFDLKGSCPGTKPRPVEGWGRPQGRYTLYCASTWEAKRIACVNKQGLVQIMDDTSGKVVSSWNTTLDSPTSLVRLTGASPGLVIGNSASVQRLLPGAPQLVLGGQWKPATGTISSVAVFASGYIVVSGSDGRLHKLQLANTAWIADTTPLPASVLPIRTLGPSAYDSTDHLFVFGTNEGRIWAIPNF